jgi:hypothetical protein
VLSNLPNGNMCVVQLEAVPETGWPQSLSDYVRAIPLSEQTLAPRASGEFRQIRVEWNAIPATGQFEVWRSTAQAGPYYNLSGPIERTSYVDTDAVGEGWYWYKVRPTLSGSAASAPNGAQTDPFCLHDPQVLGTCDTDSAYQVAVSGSYAYVADGVNGLRVIDISNPGSPTLRATCATTIAFGVAVSGSYAYVADYTSGLRVIDISNPASPTVSATRATGNALGVVVSGSYAYVADVSGLLVIDISNPGSPTSVGALGTVFAQGVAVSGSRAYVADGSYPGLRVIDLLP